VKADHSNFQTMTEEGKDRKFEGVLRTSNDDMKHESMRVKMRNESLDVDDTDGVMVDRSINEGREMKQ